MIRPCLALIGCGLHPLVVYLGPIRLSKAVNEAFATAGTVKALLSCKRFDVQNPEARYA